ncbi:hypothetical protein K1T71_001926 [Dendrolimus kikuchii]|uniref:Uncharacterized protein n=1 Tax=Dendrolimus kikuchii TaxID=765133 RepID=A0ACC1DGK5_9NEOP|nr:hypothetical protein K1T71_001926 [Dendrolimus kikuchii]
MSSKKFGLILPEKQKTLTFQASRNVFGNDSDSDDEKRKKPFSLKPSDLTKRQAKVAQEKALIEDPTVYQYDEIYDELSNKKEKDKVKTKEEKKPKYIQDLMKSANKRKIENERRVERQIQKERENEGDEFKDKEVFVTTAYKKKLEELKIEEEKEKREEYLESVGDVTKQMDLGGFYRHIYEQKLGKDKITENNNQNTEGTAEQDSNDAKKSKPDLSKARNYRKRKTSSDQTQQLSEGEIEDSEDEINRLNLNDIKQSKKPRTDKDNIDADSDFSIDESSDEDDNKKEDLNNKEEKSRESLDNNSTKVERSPKQETETEKKVHLKDLEKEEVKPKIDIWAKRTVGVVFDEALKRYYERKAARSQ